MRVFVGYGYNERDRWIEEYVIPLIQAFASDVVHGKIVYGGVLSKEVVKLIQTSDAAIGFTTRRELVSTEQYRTHDWVVHELITANAQDLPWVEVREQGVMSRCSAHPADYKSVDPVGVRVQE